MSAIESASLLGTLQIAFVQIQESTIRGEGMLTVESSPFTQHSADRLRASPGVYGPRRRDVDRRECFSHSRTLHVASVHISESTAHRNRYGPLRVLLEGVTQKLSRTKKLVATKVHISVGSSYMPVNSAAKRLHGSERFANSLGQPARAAFTCSFRFAARIFHRVHVPDKTAKS